MVVRTEAERVVVASTEAERVMVVRTEVVAVAVVMEVIEVRVGDSEA